MLKPWLSGAVLALVTVALLAPSGDSAGASVAGAFDIGKRSILSVAAPGPKDVDTPAGAAAGAQGQATTRTLVSVWAHPDDEMSVGPALARYAREGVQVHIIIATDGAQGASNTTVPRGPAIAKLRAEEARCSAQALGIEPPILLGFPDAALGSYLEDRTLLFRLTERLHTELQRLRPDVLITWGPDGGSGHPDHRLVSAIVTQLARAGAPGVPPHVFHASIPADAIRAMNPDGGAPPFLTPQTSHFTTRVPFTEADLDATRRAMACHTTQFPEAAVERMTAVMREAWKGEIPLVPMVPQQPSDDLFR
jgi:LmbE family N-acetylglucosaminyl deacetylase